MDIENQTAKYNINLTRRIYLHGKMEDVDHVRKLLKGHYFLAPRNALEMPSFIDEPTFVAYAVNFSEMSQVQKMARTMESLASPNIHKIIFISYPTQLEETELLFCKEIGARYTAFGANRDEDFKDYLKQVCVAVHKVGSVEHIEDHLQAAINAGKKDEIVKIFAKLREMKPTQEILRLLVLAAKEMPNFKRAEFYLKQMLRQNSQNLWAANELGKLYIKSKRISEGIEILRRLSNFHEMNSERFLTIGNAYLMAGMGEDAEVHLEKGDDMTGHKDSRFNDGLAKAKIAQGDTKAALEVVGDRGFSDDVISYLNLRAIMCLKRNKLDEALAYYSQALSGAHIKVIKAKLYFNMGLAYARSGLLPKAKSAFEESLRLGTPRFDRATGPLKVIHNIEKSNASGSITDDLMVEMEFDYENVG